MLTLEAWSYVVSPEVRELAASARRRRTDSIAEIRQKGRGACDTKDDIRVT